MIPILPANMIDVLEAPFPYLIGTLPNPGLEDLELENITISLVNFQLIKLFYLKIIVLFIQK